MITTQASHAVPLPLGHVKSDSDHAYKQYKIIAERHSQLHLLACAFLHPEPALNRLPMVMAVDAGAAADAAVAVAEAAADASVWLAGQAVLPGVCEPPKMMGLHVQAGVMPCQWTASCWVMDAQDWTAGCWSTAAGGAARFALRLDWRLLQKSPASVISAEVIDWTVKLSQPRTDAAQGMQRGQARPYGCSP